MSRYEVLHKDKGLAFGHDHPCGEFLMIWQRPTDSKERELQDKFGPDPEEMLVDVDTMFNKDFNRDKMIELIIEHNFTINELKQAYETFMYMENEKIYNSLDELERKVKENYL